MAATVSVMRFALENARLTATVRAQLEEVRASRTRLVAAGEAERRRIERDLHDGAQQRLIGVTLTLQQAREQARLAHPGAPYVQLLDDASDELLAAVDELRELARGIHPAILTEVGLRPAVAGLARRSSVPVDLRVELADRLEPGVEAAAYFIVAEALTNVTRHSGARQAAVLIERHDGHLRVQVSDDGAGGADASRGTGLEGISDRLDAISGVLSVDSPHGGGTRLRAEIPCA
jgi:signal transduction histidine kinase